MKNVHYFNFLILFIFLFCKDTPYNFKNSQEMYLYYSKELCSKMYNCLKPYTRTLKIYSQSKLDKNICINNIKKQILSNDYIDSEKIQQKAIKCYDYLLKVECKTFLTAPYVQFDCLELKKITIETFLHY
ncbi:MAG: hypothetical protein KatS3mg129_0632 [Leptospiraceae bacterium]|nr:MAG: hypothetical protein KatS3mg129_0632 [Leptospiraceae bacterium]